MFYNYLVGRKNEFSSDISDKENINKDAIKYKGL